MTTTVHLALVPRDGFFCKDGRGWFTSASGRGYGLDWPWPSTILGALRTAWGRGEEAKSHSLFGPEDWLRRTGKVRLGRTLALRRHHGAPWCAKDTIWPVPLDALWLEGRRDVLRLEPAPPLVPTLGRDDDEVREGLMRPALDDPGKPLAPARWWNREDFSAWLAGQAVAIRDPEDALATTSRVQVHVGLLPDELTADEGALFSHDVIETIDRNAEWAIGAEVTLPDEALAAMATLGSDRRLAYIESLPEDLFDPPDQVLQAFRLKSAGLRVVAVTPLCFDQGWLPDGLKQQEDVYRGQMAGIQGEVILRAAFVARPLHVSGWDIVTKTPKPVSRMVAPGAVYFFERGDGQAFDEADAHSLWLAALGSRTDEGFGRVVPGVWSPKRSIP